MEESTKNTRVEMEIRAHEAKMMEEAKKKRQAEEAKNKIPSPEEMEASGDYEDYGSIARTFARLHIRAALKAVHEKYNIPLEELHGLYPAGNHKL